MLWFLTFGAFIGAIATSGGHGDDPKTTTASSSPGSVSWGPRADSTSISPKVSYRTSGFGSRTASYGTGVAYQGNIGSPYCSNIIEVTAANAREYKYVARFESSTMDEWSVAVWNKIGPDGKQGGWFSKPCKTFILKSGSIQYVAFDEDSQGGWAAAPGPFIPTDKQSAFASTWGEFDFGSVINTEWSGFDVSAIVAQNAGLDVQGMRICDELAQTCSSITANAAAINNAYTRENFDQGGIGGNIAPGPVRLNVTLGYSHEPAR